MAAEKGSHRVTLPQIRAGEYEGINQKVRKSKLKTKNKYPVNLLFSLVIIYSSA
jgi:glutamate formiminotransferase